MPSALRFVVASAATVGLGASRRAPGARARGVLSNASSLAELTPSATVSELGIDRLASIAGGTPVSWEERQLARILESTGQDDYGEITRLTLDLGGGQGPQSYIAKRVRPRSDASVPPDPILQAEHRRFLQSFVVEGAAYRELTEPLAERGLVVPRAFHLPEARAGEPFTILMEDLSGRFPRGAGARTREMSRAEVQAALRWLAAFHATFWEEPKAVERGLFERGSFWILDELGSLQLGSVRDDYDNAYISNGEFRRLRAAAQAVDARLSGRRAIAPHEGVATTHRTLVHGDSKPANMLCSAHDGELQCAAIDFAWAGEGYGVYDVMHLLWRVASTDEVNDHLAYYYAELAKLLPIRVRQVYTYALMLKHFELCVLDRVRWWTGHYGGDLFVAMPWALALMRVALARLDGGHLKSPEEYAIAVDDLYLLE